MEYVFSFSPFVNLVMKLGHQGGCKSDSKDFGKISYLSEKYPLFFAKFKQNLLHSEMCMSVKNFDYGICKLRYNDSYCPLWNQIGELRENVCSYKRKDNQPSFCNDVLLIIFDSIVYAPYLFRKVTNLEQEFSMKQ